MNKDQKIEVIRNACIKANPEIVELYEACGWHTDAFNWRECKQCTETAKPHPIRLADVLLAGERIGVKTRMADALVNLREYEKDVRWNIRCDDLNQQSDECVGFIYSLCPDSKE